LQEDSGRLSQRRVPPQGFLQFGLGQLSNAELTKKVDKFLLGWTWLSISFRSAVVLSLSSALGMFSELVKTPPDGGTSGSHAGRKGFKIPRCTGEPNRK